MAQTNAEPQSTEHSAQTLLMPDFSGTWAHPYIPGFEPPLSGPGPVVNRIRRKQFFDTEGIRLPPGVDAPLASSTAQYVGDYTNSILRPHSAEIAAALTSSNQCWPGGVPYVFWNLEMQMFQPDTMKFAMSA
jgi:hypothetical protein